MNSFFVFWEYQMKMMQQDYKSVMRLSLNKLVSNFKKLRVHAYLS